MGWFVAILSTLMLVLLGGVAVLLVWTHRLLQGVTSICLYLNDTEEEMALEEQAQRGDLIKPDDIPLSRHLHDVIAQPPKDDDGKVGEFQGRLPWMPPPDKDNIE